MRYIKMKRVIALVVLLTVVAIAGLASADNFPSYEERASAEKTGQLLHNELFAALIQEFNEPLPRERRRTGPSADLSAWLDPD